MEPQQLIDDVSQLFTLPEAALRLNELLALPDSSVQELAGVIELDPGLAAALLKLANSAYYGLSQRVNSIDRAIGLIGERELQVMAMATAVVSTFKGLPADLVDMTSFWENSVSCGVIARILGRRSRSRRSEQLFLAGLLHGVGKLVFYIRRPEQYRALLMAVDDCDERSLAAAEARVFGFDAATLGALLLKSWQLPVMLQVLVACQLRPDEAGDFASEAMLLHVASEIAANVSPTVKGGAPSQAGSAGLDANAWTWLGIDSSMLTEVIQEADMQALAILEIINPRASIIY